MNVAINMRPHRGPWGGGNQWLSQMAASLRAKGHAVRFDLRRPVDCLIIAHSKPSESGTFGVDEAAAYLARHPETACLHRINENDLRKQTDFMDRLLAQANELADYTVFISAWLRDYHAQRWFDARKPHAVILNAADSAVFNPAGGVAWRPGQPLRLVTHHWSSHPNRGFDVYQQLDGLIADGRLPGTELRIIGRWPREIRWRAAKTFAPIHGPRLARLLRESHVYVTASRWEPGGMHVVEGLQCGLPILYHNDGGGLREAAAPFGISFRDDPCQAVEEMRRRYQELRVRLLSGAPSGERMCDAYVEAIEEARRLAGRRAGSPSRMVVFFTRGMSLEEWDRRGMLERELALYRLLRPSVGRVAFLTYGGQDEAAYRARIGDAEILANRWGLSSNFYSLAAPLLHQRVLRQASVYKTNQLNGAWSAAIAKRLFKKPLVVRCGYVWSDFAARIGTPRWKQRVILALERWTVRSADRIVVATEADAGALVEAHGVARDRITVIPNYVDLERFRPRPKIPKQAGQLCFIGRLEDQKNPLALLEALRGLDGLRLVMVGEGSLRAAIEQRIRQERLPVELRGIVAHDQLPELLNRSQAFILPSRFEGHPKALLEAMACGLPVIGADAPGIREVLRHGENGVVCGDSAESIRAAITAVTADAELARRLGAQARRDVEAQCSLEVVIERERGVLTGLINGHGGVA